jgi:putative transposase
VQPPVCRLTSQQRSSQRYQRRLVPEEALLRQRLQLLARRHPRYGYRRIHAILGDVITNASARDDSYV